MGWVSSNWHLTFDIAIAMVNRESDTKIHELKLIIEAFSDFYVELYSSQGVDSWKIDNFLGGIVVPGLDGGLQDSLEAKLTHQEVLNAIENLPGGKSPGPDGFPVDFYKTFAADLITPLMDMLRHAIEINQLPKH